MSDYSPRIIKFTELVSVEDWKVKVYTITKDKTFNATVTYDKAINSLPSWLKLENSFDASNDKIAFLIIHSGNEGVFTILNWWVGKNMLNTQIYISEYHNPKEFRLISGDGLSPCIWELEVINHERLSWIKNILKQSDKPNIETYLNDNYNGTL